MDRCRDRRARTRILRDWCGSKGGTSRWAKPSVSPTPRRRPSAPKSAGSAPVARALGVPSLPPPPTPTIRRRRDRRVSSAVTPMRVLRPSTALRLAPAAKVRKGVGGQGMCPPIAAKRSTCFCRRRAYSIRRRLRRRRLRVLGGRWRRKGGWVTRGRRRLRR